MTGLSGHSRNKFQQSRVYMWIGGALLCMTFGINNKGKDQPARVTLAVTLAVYSVLTLAPFVVLVCCSQPADQKWLFWFVCFWVVSVLLLKVGVWLGGLEIKLLLSTFFTSTVGQNKKKNHLTAFTFSYGVFWHLARDHSSFTTHSSITAAISIVSRNAVCLRYELFKLDMHVWCV